MPEIIVSYSDTESSMRKWKGKSDDLLTNPHNPSEIIEQIPPLGNICNSSAINNEQFVHSIPSSCVQAGSSIVCYLESSIAEMGEMSNMAFIDGTHKYFPSYFSQLLIIHLGIKKHVRFR